MERAVLPRHEAAAYVGCKDAAQFAREVRKGIWPGPIVNSRPPRWSKLALDRKIEERAGIEHTDADWDRYVERASENPAA